MCSQRHRASAGQRGAGNEIGGPPKGLRVPRGVAGRERRCASVPVGTELVHGKDTGVSVKSTCRNIQASVSGVHVEDTGVSVKCTCRNIQASVSSVHVENTDVSVERVRPMGRSSGPRDTRWLMSRAKILETGHGLMLTRRRSLMGHQPSKSVRARPGSCSGSLRGAAR